MSSAQHAWNAAFSALAASGIPLDRVYPSLHQSSLGDLNARLNATFAFAEGLGSLDEGAAVLLRPRLPQIDASTATIKSQSEAVVAALSGYTDASVSDPSGTLQFQFTRGGTVAANVGFNVYLDQVSGQQSVLMDQLTLALRFGRYKGHGLFQERARELQTIADELRRLLDKCTSTSADVDAALQVATSAASSASAEQKAAEAQHQSAVQAVAGAQKAAAEIDAKLATVREVSKTADALRTTVEKYEPSFKSFQQSLDTRLAQHESFQRETAMALEENSRREAQIAALIKNADSMIRGATTAGLSHSLETTQAAYEARLRNTGWWFLGSVVVLLVCSLPIVGQLIPGPWQEFFKPVSGANSDPWLSTLGKFILLIPATWATAFFAGNYAELFHLSREYAHKAALAKSIDGFKREAPDFEQEIVAGVFMEIRENPGSRKSPEPASPQNPIGQRILEKLLDAIKAKRAPAK